MKKIKILKTFHEIFLFVYYIVLFGNQYVGSAYLRHIRAALFSYSRNAERQDCHDWWQHDRPQYLS